jgi:hypothetical protein
MAQENKVTQTAVSKVFVGACIKQTKPKIATAALNCLAVSGQS